MKIKENLNAFDAMNLMVALIISLLNDFLKFDFPNNVLKTEVSFCTKIFRSIEHIIQKGLSLKCIICAIEKDGNGGFISLKCKIL